MLYWNIAVPRNCGSFLERQSSFSFPLAGGAKRQPVSEFDDDEVMKAYHLGFDTGFGVALI